VTPPFTRYHTSVAVHTALLVTPPAMCHDAGSTSPCCISIRFDMFNVLGGNWDPTDQKKNSSVNSENAEFE